jgi:predicted N-acetyltransferase YhbS
VLAAPPAETGGAVELAQEAPQDGWEIEALYDLAFAPGRTALSSYRLREGVVPVGRLCLVARDGPDGPLAGAIRFWPVRAGAVPALLLGPVAVHPTHQGEGIGAALIGEGLARAAADGWARVLLVGDLSYYGRFGFRRLAGITMPPPTDPGRILGWGDWSGVAGPVGRWAG